MTDWDKELAKIDKQLASISDDELMKSDIYFNWKHHVWECGCPDLVS